MIANLTALETVVDERAKLRGVKMTESETAPWRKLFSVAAETGGARERRAGLRALFGEVEAVLKQITTETQSHGEQKNKETNEREEGCHL